MLPFYLVVTFPGGFPVKELHTKLFTLPIPSTCPADLILFHLIPLIINHGNYKLRNSWKCSFFPVLFLSSLNALCRNIFLDTFNLRPPFRARTKSTHPLRKKNGTIIFILKFLLYYIRVRIAVFDLPTWTQDKRNLQSYGAYWCQWAEVMNYISVHLSSISPQSINLFAFIFLHSVSVLLWPCDIYYLSFLLHAVSISSALTIFQFSAVQCHTVSTCYCRIIMTTNMSYFQRCTSPDLPRPGTCAYFVQAYSILVLCFYCLESKFNYAFKTLNTTCYRIVLF